MGAQRLSGEILTDYPRRRNADERASWGTLQALSSMIRVLTHISDCRRLAAAARVVGIAACIAVPVFLLYGTRLGYSPIYLAHDEAIYALCAHAIATTARDVNGHLLPLYFYIGGNFWDTPIGIYSMALFLKVFGVSESIIRTPSAVIGTLDVVLVYFVARRLFASRLQGATAAALLALTPAHFIHSRLATDHIYVLPFVLGWLLCLIAFCDRQRAGALFAGGSLLGVGVYTYLASVVLMPAYLLVTFIVLYRRYGMTPRPFLVAIAGFAWPLIPLVPWLLSHPTQYADHLRMYSLYDSRHLSTLQGLKEMLSRTGVTARTDVYYEFFNPSFLFFAGDTSYINGTRHAGVFPLALALLLPFGIYAVLLARRTPMIETLLLGFFLAPIAAVLVAEVKINRALVIMPFAALIASAGLAWMLGGGRARQAAALALLLAVPLQFRSFYRDYMNEYRLLSGYWFEGNIRGGLEELMRRNPPGAGRPVYLGTDIQWLDWYWPLYLVKERRQDLQAHTVYFDPKTINVHKVPTGSSILARTEAASQQPFLSAGPLRNLTPIREPNGSAYFAVFER